MPASTTNEPTPEKVIGKDETLPCLHMNFSANVAVDRVLREPSQVTGEQDPVPMYYLANLTVHCLDCGHPMKFVGAPLGMSAYKPHASADAVSLRAPMTPTGELPEKGIPSFSVRLKRPDELKPEEVDATRSHLSVVDGKQGG